MARSAGGGRGVSRAGKWALIAAALAAAGNAPIVHIEWNSHPVVHPTTTALKQAHALDPLSFSLAHLLDFTLTDRQVAVPALRAGHTVLADRYLYTPWVRVGVRGRDSSLLRAVAPAFIQPDRTFYVAAALDDIRDRYRRAPLKYGHYGTGADLPGAATEAEERFIAYQRKQMDLYAEIAAVEGFTPLSDPADLAACLRGVQ